MKTIFDENCIVGEGPIWDKSRRLLFWTDILGQKIYSFNIENNNVELIYEGMIAGALVFDQENNILAFDDSGVKRLFLDAKGKCFKIDEVYKFNLKDNERFNDAEVDSMGRVFSGVMSADLKDGKLYRFEKGKEPVVVLENIGITNGMVFIKLDKTYFYHTDSKDKTITRYDYDEETGSISFPKIIYTGDDENGVPDGITCDENNNIWIACWGGSKIFVIDFEGNYLKKIDIPAIQVSSLCFGGDEMNEVFVTTAGVGGNNILEALNVDGDYLGGKVYSFKSQIKGLSENRAKI